MKYNINYANKWHFEKLAESFDDCGLVQLVEFDTWSRLVNGHWRSSVLDHVYVNDATIIKNLTNCMMNRMTCLNGKIDYDWLI